jgi:nucleoside-diphosphate-sugar epimerase
MSAYPGTTQLYGRAKLAIEEATLAVGGIAVRPGLVYGDPPRGMAGTLVKLTRLPLVPVLAGRTRQFPVHQDDFAPAIVEILESENWVPEIIGIAQPTPMTFKEVLVALASREGRRCRFVPVPWRSVYWSLRVAERAGIPVTLRSDSVLGLIRAADHVPASQAFPTLPLKLRTLTSMAGNA